MRSATILRDTKETKINLTINLDGSGKSKINTGVGFFDHMLTLISFHGQFDLDVECIGDLEVDSHHTVEDVGIALGQCFKVALGDKLGINRYGSFRVVMDEALVTTDLDISARAYLVYNVEVTTPILGNFETEMCEEFFRAFCYQAGITLHINKIYGKNSHHIIEAAFKSCGRALKQAIKIEAENMGKIASTKGLL